MAERQMQFPWSSNNPSMLNDIDIYISAGLLPWRHPDRCRENIRTHYYSPRMAFSYTIAIPLLTNSSDHKRSFLLDQDGTTKLSQWLLRGKPRSACGLTDSDLNFLLEATDIIINDIKWHIFGGLRNDIRKGYWLTVGLTDILSPGSIAYHAWNFLLAVLLDGEQNADEKGKILGPFLELYQLIAILRGHRPLLVTTAACLSYKSVFTAMINHPLVYPLATVAAFFQTDEMLTDLLINIHNAVSLRTPYVRSQFARLFLLLAATPDCPNHILETIKKLPYKRAQDISYLRDPTAPPERLLKILLTNPRSYGRSASWYYAAALSHPNAPQEAKLDLLFALDKYSRNYQAIRDLICA